MKEQKFIDLITEMLPESARYIGDDTAFISEKDIIITQDTLIEDVHFRLNTIPPYYLGRKSVAVNLSDIAAAGGVPKYLTISLSMPKHIDDEFIKEFYRGVRSICLEYNTVVVGGDMTGGEKIAISICAVGYGEGLQPANRKNAQAGDVVAVTGVFGSSVAGLFLLEDGIIRPAEITEKFIQAHINPVPKLKEGRVILENAKTPAMMDTSDGLADALYKICSSNGVGMEVEFDEIPHDKDIFEINKCQNTITNWILFGGEDYELVATMPEQVFEKIKNIIPIKKIGVVTAPNTSPYPVVRFSNGDKLIIDKDSFDKNTFMFRHFE